MSSLKDNGSTSQWRRIRQQVLSRDMHACCICGRDDLPLSVDHILERAKGGTDEMGNLQTLCKSCHEKKTSFFLKKKPPLPIAWGISLQKSDISGKKSQMSVIDGDEVFDV